MGVACSSTCSRAAADSSVPVHVTDAAAEGSPATAEAAADDFPATAHLTLNLEKALGAGTSGAAWLVANRLDGFRYCVKRVPLPDTGAHAAAANEAALHARVTHDACVRYCFSWIDEAAPPHFCLLMELCESDLWSFLEAAAAYGGDAIAIDDRARWSAQLSGALVHLHERGVVHRDLNPWNVMVSRRRGGGGKGGGGDPGGVDLKLGDFGLSVDCPPGHALSGHETEGAAPLDASALTSLYSAPELGSAAYGPPADVYSLGMTLFVVWAAADGRSMDALVGGVEAVHGGGAAEPALLGAGGDGRAAALAPALDSLVARNPAARPSAAGARAAVHEAAERASTLSC